MDHRGGASDRITLDVGGTKFVTGTSTLTTNSSYFAALLSDNWRPGDIFLDQKPEPFGVLLAYMRSGMIRVDDIDTDVLALAEFLGMERLLLAIKVRWYINIGKGPVLSQDEEIAAAFDQMHGGTLKAISSGLHPLLLNQDIVNAEKILATMTIKCHDYEPKVADFEGFEFLLSEIGESDLNAAPGPLDCQLIAAINWLHLRGYTVHERQLDKGQGPEYTMTFSRRKHSAIASDATDIFIPNDNEINQNNRGLTKQFAMLIEGDLTITKAILPDTTPTANHHSPFYHVINGRMQCLEETGFIEREEEYENIFKDYVQAIIAHYFRDGTPARCRIYSRKVPINLNEEEMQA